MLLSSIGCFATWISIENPYENVGVQWKLTPGTCYQRTSMNKSAQRPINTFSVGNEAMVIRNTDKMEIQIILNKGTNDEIVFSPKEYYARERNRSEGQHFVEEFYVGNKPGKIAYSIKVQYKEHIRNLDFKLRAITDPIIEAIGVKVSYVAIDGTEMTKNSEL